MSARKAAAVILVAAAVGVALYDYIFIMVWDGSFSLTVHLRPAEPDRVARVWAAATYRRDYADEVLSDQKFDHELTPINDWKKPFVVEVRCSGAESGLGRRKVAKSVSLPDVSDGISGRPPRRQGR